MTAAVALQAPDLWTRCRRIRQADHLTPAGRLLPIDEARALLAEIENAMRPIGPKAAASLVRRMLAGYPRLDVHDPEGYIATLAAELAQMPAEIAAAVVDEVTRECRFLPTRADLHGAAKVAMLDRADMRWRIASHVAQHEERSRLPPPPPPRIHRPPPPPPPVVPMAPPPAAPAPDQAIDPDAARVEKLIASGLTREQAWLTVMNAGA